MTPLARHFFSEQVRLGRCRLVSAAPFQLRAPSSASGRREAHTAVRPSAGTKELARVKLSPRKRLEEWERVPPVTELQWSPPLKILRYPDPALRALNLRIGVFDETLQRLVDDLLDCMYNSDDGVGLAAPQTGVNLRLMVMNPSGKRGSPEEVALVNPRILEIGGGAEVDEEGCLSFPQIFADVKRRTTVKLQAQDMRGNSRIVGLSGFKARIFLHEYDHLQGRLFHERMDPIVQRTVQGRLWALEEAYKREHPGEKVEHFAAV